MKVNFLLTYRNLHTIDVFWKSDFIFGRKTKILRFLIFLFLQKKFILAQLTEISNFDFWFVDDSYFQCSSYEFGKSVHGWSLFDYCVLTIYILSKTSMISWGLIMEKMEKFFFDQCLSAHWDQQLWFLVCRYFIVSMFNI
jgi:hypothetical protein